MARARTRGRRTTTKRGKPAPRRSRRRGSRKRPAWTLRSLMSRAAVMAAMFGLAYVAWLDLDMRAKFEGKRWSVPARIYARPLELYAGARLGPSDFERELSLAGYHRSDNPRRAGSYRRDASHFRVLTREFQFWDRREPQRTIEVGFEGNRLASLSEGTRPIALARLDPAEIAQIYPAHREDRILVSLREVPPLLVQGLLAVEDRGFFSHHGLSPRGIARAMLANLRAGAAVQGGSTLTQQLAKNFFLTPKRSLARKLNEALLAVLLELRYEKPELLEAYLNEVFLGQRGRRAIHGFGLAAWYYYRRPLAELRSEELALLIGLVKGPSYYSPRRHPERARARRDTVLALMVEQGVMTRSEGQAARARPLGVSPAPGSSRSSYPAFVDLVRRQLRRDYDAESLRSEGLRIFTTLDPMVQASAEAAVSEEIARLEAGRGARGARLQGALAVTATGTGEVLALVGSRTPSDFGFNRALDAVRPIGSLAKPAVYLAALAQPERYTLASPVSDAPVRIADEAGGDWVPRNYDGRSHGRVPLYEALARSYNQATVRIGMEVGIDEVADYLHRLGVRRRLGIYPAMMLGAFDLSPIEVAQMYHTLASGGFRVPLRSIREVTDARGRKLSRYGVSVSRGVAPELNFLMINALEAVMREGTGRAASRRLPAGFVSAGKTGTTDDLRDSWFAGFAGDRLAVVWLGHDDNSPAGFTGASGALSVWTDLMLRLKPASLDPSPPPGIEWHWVDLDSGHRTPAGCPDARKLPFVAGSEPAPGGCRASAAASGRSNG